MSEKEEELKPIAQKDAPKKYVAVVYHHVSYQNEEGAVSLHDDGQGSSKSGNSRRPNSQTKVADVSDYFILSLISIVIFIPTGLTALINSLKVRKALKHKDIKNAIEASNLALQHSLTAIFTGPLLACMLFLVIYLPMYQIK